MNFKIISIFLLSAVFFQCKSGIVLMGGNALSNNTYASPGASAKIQDPKIITRPSRISAEVEDRFIEGTSTNTIILFLFSINEAKGILSSYVKKVQKTLQTGMDIDIAAGKAVDAGNADGIFITDVKEEVTGLFPLYYTTKTTVRGKPIQFKIKGVLSEEKSDKPLTFQIQQVDTEIKVLREAINQTVGKQVQFPEYKE